MPWAAAGAVVGALITSSAAGDAADAQSQSAASAQAESRRQFDLTRGDTAPYRSAGTNALASINAMEGLPQYQAPQQNSFSGGTYGLPFGGGSFTVPNQQQTAGPPPVGFMASPDYQFRRDEGNRGIEQTAAARGGAFSGNALRALTDYNSNLASAEYGNRFNRLASIAGLGQTANGQSAQAGASSAYLQGNALMAGGDARASGIQNQANVWGNAVNQLGRVGADYWSNRSPVQEYTPTTKGRY